MNASPVANPCHTDLDGVVNFSIVNGGVTLGSGFSGDGESLGLAPQGENEDAASGR